MGLLVVGGAGVAGRSQSSVAHAPVSRANRCRSLCFAAINARFAFRGIEAPSRTVATTSQSVSARAKSSHWPGRTRRSASRLARGRTAGTNASANCSKIAPGGTMPNQSGRGQKRRIRGARPMRISHPSIALVLLGLALPLQAPIASAQTADSILANKKAERERKRDYIPARPKVGKPRSRQFYCRS